MKAPFTEEDVSLPAFTLAKLGQDSLVIEIAEPVERMARRRNYEVCLRPLMHKPEDSRMPGRVLTPFSGRTPGEAATHRRGTRSVPARRF